MKLKKSKFKAIKLQPLNDDLKAELAEIYGGDMLLADGFEDAFIGVGLQAGIPLAIYSRKACIEILVKEQKMELSWAIEYFEHNTACAWVGPCTPLFLE
tara:strand:- start:109 stop:405 length:297 start_codon:yes stop_codon:yes gene_type:complete